MTPRWQLFTVGLFVLVTIATAAPSGDQAKSDQHPKESSKDLKTETADVVKDKRSQEDIMFGNQQNKPAAGMVDDMLSYPERKSADNQADKSDPSGKSDNSTQEDNKESGQDETRKVERELQKNNKDGDDDRFDYYDYLDDANEFRGGDNYDTSAADGANDYQYDDINALYRRKRNLKSVNRKRALRSSLEELLVNGKRLPRRALRLKRDVDVDDLLAMFGALSERQNNDRYYPEIEVPKNYIPLEDLQEIADAELRYPYNVLDDSEVPAGRLLEERPPTMNRHYSGNSRQREPLPDWLLAKDYSPFTVARRSSYFYPLDYRHVMLPGQKRFNSDRGDFSRWGKIPQRSNSLDDDGDLERLYELASLLEEAQQGNNY